MAAARGLHEGAVDVAVLLEEVVTRHRHADHGMQRLGFVGAAHRPPFEIVEQLVDDELDLADNDGVAMLERLLRHEARMDAAHDHRHAFGAESIGDLVAAVDVTRHRRNADEIGLQVEIDGLDVLVGEHHLILVARDAGGDRQQTGERRIQRPVHVERAGGQRIGFRIDRDE